MKNIIKEKIERTYEAIETSPGNYEKGEEYGCSITSYDEEGNVTSDSQDESYTVYEEGKPIREIGDGYITRYAYDSQGLLVSMIRNAEGDIAKWTIEYKEDGGRVEIGENEVDSSENQRNEYDGLGNLVHTTDCISDISYEYDENGNRVYEEGRYGENYCFAGYCYNEHGRLVQILKAVCKDPANIGSHEDDFLEEIETLYYEDGTRRKVNSYRCQTGHIDDFFDGKYTKEIMDVWTYNVEEVTEEDRLIKTVEEQVNGVLREKEISTYSLPDKTLLKKAVLIIDEEESCVIETEYEYWV